MSSEDWSRLQAREHLLNKLYTQLGPTEYGADDTVSCCRELSQMSAVDRPNYIIENWGLLTDKVEFLLTQLETLEKRLGEVP